MTATAGRAALRTRAEGRFAPTRLDRQVIVSAPFISAAAVFVSSQVQMVVLTEGDLGFWGFAIIGSIGMSIIALLCAAAAAWLVYLLARAVSLTTQRYLAVVVLVGAGVAVVDAALLAGLLAIYPVVMFWPTAVVAAGVAGAIATVSA